MKRFMHAVFLFSFVLLPGIYAEDQKNLYWNKVDVRALLKNDGSLDITEIQTMNFTGNWNGGYRDLSLRPGQTLDFDRIERYVNNKWIPVIRGDIDRTDRYTVENHTKIKWRSRLASDPPFDHTEIVYKLHYTIKGEILLKVEDHYTLDYDFLFPDRNGIVETYHLDLKYDDQWKPASDFRQEYFASNIEPGKSFIIKADFEFLGAEDLIVSKKVLSGNQKIAVKLFFLGFLVFLILAFIAIEIKRGRLRALPSIKIVDAAFLKKYIYDFEPEEVGALWDGQIGSAEVAAILAKHISLGNLRSTWIKKKRLGIFTSKDVQLELLTSLDKFDGEEQKLIKKMFPKGNITSKEKIYNYYKTHSEGFDPSNEIRGPIELKLKSIPDLGDKNIKDMYWILPLTLVLLSLFLAIKESRPLGPENFLLIYASVVLLYAVPAGFTYSLFSGNLRYRIENPLKILLRLLLRLLIPAICFVSFIDLFDLRLYGYIASVLCASSLMALFTLTAITRNSRKKLDFRRNITVARNYLHSELKKKNPNLTDSAIPYLIALELADHLDRWSSIAGKSTGADSFDAASMSSGSHSGSGSSFGGGGSKGFTGGGGSFGGAGATGSWAAAAISLGAVSVADSSSSSGGGGRGRWWRRRRRRRRLVIQK